MTKANETRKTLTERVNEILLPDGDPRTKALVINAIRIIETRRRRSAARLAKGRGYLNRAKRMLSSDKLRYADSDFYRDEIWQEIEFAIDNGCIKDAVLLRDTELYKQTFQYNTRNAITYLKKARECINSADSKGYEIAVWNFERYGKIANQNRGKRIINRLDELYTQTNGGSPAKAEYEYLLKWRPENIPDDHKERKEYLIKRYPYLKNLEVVGEIK